MAKYNQDQTDYIIKEYKQVKDRPWDDREEVMERLAEEFNTSKHSIRSLLSTQGVYLKKEYRTKLGTKPVTKESLIRLLEKYLNLRQGELASFEGANKKAIFILIRKYMEKAGDPEDIFTEVFE